MSRHWVTISALALSLSWLLPNHSLPWNSFHGDAWGAVILTLVSIYILWKTEFKIYGSILNGAVLFLAAIPLLQFLSGEIYFFGVAWINSVYLIGLLMAMVVGANWERSQQHQLGDFVFLAVTCASICSVALQIHQFLRLEVDGPWILLSNGLRPSANMGQPNLLASLLLLGCIGCAWAYARRMVHWSILVLLAATFVVGIALTESRTAVLNFTLFIFVGGLARKTLPSKRFLWIVLSLWALLLALTFALPAIREHLFGDIQLEPRAVVGDPRWGAWKMFVRAVLHHPIVGYGWGQLAKAQFQMMNENTMMGGSYLQAHNILLDFALWNGLPITLIYAVLAVSWYWKIICRIDNFSQLLLVIFVNVLLVHAMLEYPLQYAYFLLPFGLVLGALSVGAKLEAPQIQVRWVGVLLMSVATVMLTITISDYFRIESSFYGLRFEMKKIKSSYSNTPPDVTALTQWKDYVQFANMTPRANLSQMDLEWMRSVVSTVPSPYVMFNLARMLAMNGGGAESQQWLKRLCLTSPQQICETVKAEWAEQSKIHKEFAAIKWSLN